MLFPVFIRVCICLETLVGTHLDGIARRVISRNVMCVGEQWPTETGHQVTCLMLGRVHNARGLVHSVICQFVVFQVFAHEAVEIKRQDSIATVVTGKSVIRVGVKWPRMKERQVKHLKLGHVQDACKRVGSAMPQFLKIKESVREKMWGNIQRVGIVAIVVIGNNAHNVESSWRWMMVHVQIVDGMAVSPLHFQKMQMTAMVQTTWRKPTFYVSKSLKYYVAKDSFGSGAT